MVEVNLVSPKAELNKEDYRAPLGLCYLSSSLKQAGYSVKCQDLNFEELDLNCKYLGVSITTFQYKEAINVMLKAKEKGIITIAGGIQTYIDSEDLLNKGFDHVVIGDGEYKIVDIIAGLEAVINVPKIDNGFVNNLDELPYPDFSWVNWNNYVPKTISMETSRSCPYNCSFCIRPNRIWRYKSPKRIVEEFSLYKNKVIEIVDDVFTCNKKRIFELKDLMKKERLDVCLSLMNGVRIDSLDEEMVKTLKSIGTSNINIGVESIHQDVLNACNKGITFNQIENCVKLLKKYGYQNNASIYMIIGLPESTLNKDLECIEWVKKQKMKSSWCLATPFPKTGMFEWVNKFGKWLINPKDYSNYCGLYSKLIPMFETKDYDRDKRLYAINKAKQEVERK